MAGVSSAGGCSPLHVGIMAGVSVETPLESVQSVCGRGTVSRVTLTTCLVYPPAGL